MAVKQYFPDNSGKFYEYLGSSFSISASNRELPENAKKPQVPPVVGINDKWIPMYPEDLSDEINNKVTIMNNGWKIIPMNLLPKDFLSNPIYSYKDPSTGRILNPEK